MRLAILASAVALCAAAAPAMAQNAVDSNAILKSLMPRATASAPAAGDDDGGAVDTTSRGIKHKGSAATASVATAPAPAAGLRLDFLERGGTHRRQTSTPLARSACASAVHLTST